MPRSCTPRARRDAVFSCTALRSSYYTIPSYESYFFKAVLGLYVRTVTVSGFFRFFFPHVTHFRSAVPFRGQIAWNLSETVLPTSRVRYVWHTCFCTVHCLKGLRDDTHRKDKLGPEVVGPDLASRGVDAWYIW